MPRDANVSLSFDYTPEYLFEPHVPRCLCGALALTASARCANRKFLVLLREPVARTVPAAGELSISGLHSRRGRGDSAR